ncbi:2'-5' RNA ligase [Neoasaia chiangmaiensis NBRC 101099]|uniref:RNA 2',3'-cyclic phosphodiesterase n=1 Tax=Neoasaia chiangmaiensis TaxID=320497 RepID=A0A1U9KUB7_9PROT|nr:RNA 2',3'-cyclic phosphodiesterase [Neoasaia chiangmaiensis]AQS89250.1 hypothetical protein A0U93_03350 [Neoasaia chiangmaiensis]GBR38128.1 2'-5' RNA ligase [Neoasaia chiangmaiensis NBRC 101099]GEN16033.1 RNA 2',3'-cyclic phosphodiesterase [Neoasaia chiangmaiensis]
MRLFTALDIAPPQKKVLASMRGSLPGAIWLPPESYHVTLRFLGEIESRHTAEEIDFALSRITAVPFALQLNGTGLTTTGRGRKLWIGVERSDELLRLQARIESALRRIGLVPDKRRFQPHVVIAHLPDDTLVERWMQIHNLGRYDPMPIDRFALFESHRGPDAPHYENCAEYLLDPKAVSLVHPA